jgi:molecular chaperone HscB
MQQLEWREQLEAARTVSQVDQLQGIVDAEYARSLSTLAWLIDEKGDYPQAAQQVRVLMFMDRFMKNINDKLDQLDA